MVKNFPTPVGKVHKHKCTNKRDTEKICNKNKKSNLKQKKKQKIITLLKRKHFNDYKCCRSCLFNLFGSGFISGNYAF